MNTLDNIQGRCRVDDITGCWHWSGALSGGKYPRIYAPDHTTSGGAMRTQAGTRAVWHVATGQPIPPGHRVYHKVCSNAACLNPAHMACGPTADWGKQVARHGIWKAQPARIQANRAIGRQRSHVTPQVAAQILASTESNVALAARIGITHNVISRFRRGELTAVQSVGNPFAGLMT